MYKEKAVSTPRIGLTHHNIYYRTLNLKTTRRGRDGTAFNSLMKLSHAKVTAAVRKVSKVVIVSVKVGQ